MSPWQAVHLQLLQRLPVRRHEWQPPPEGPYDGRQPKQITEYRRAQIRKMLADGVPKRHMGPRLEISRTAVQKHLRAIAAEGK